MSRLVLRVAWFRFRAGLRRRASGYLSIVLLVGLVGGVAMGAVAAARRTQSSFPAYMRSTNPSDLHVVDLAQVTVGNHVSDFQQTLAGLPNVRRVASWGVPNVLELALDGTPATANADAEANGVFIVVSPDGLYADQDRVTVVQGRMADPARANEIVMSATAAQALGDRIGSVHHLGFYTNDQANSPGFRTAGVPAYFTLDVTLVGIVVFNNEVVQDDTDRLPTDVLLSPAIAGRLAQCCGADGFSAGLQLDHGSRDLSAVETEIANAIPTAVVTSVTSTQIAKAERAIEPEAIALAVFGGIAALAALLIVGQVIGRQLRFGADDVGVLRGLGAGPAITTTDGLIGVVGAVIVGAALACAVAIGLSPLAPLGPVRAVDPTSGVTFDWTVLGLGLLVLIIGLSGVAVATAHRVAPERVARRRWSETRPSVLAGVVSIAGVPPSATMGIQFAVEPGSGKNAAPVRSAMLGGGLAVVVVIATLIFGASLHTLVSRPALYGWNWDYELRSAYSGISNIPQDKAKPLLDGDDDVAAWTGVYFATAQIDGLTVPVLGADPGATVAPSMLSGHALEKPDEVVLGATTLAQLHKQLGDSVSVTFVGSGQPTPLVIAGTAALPAVGIAVTLHMGLTSGAVVSQTLFPAEDRGFGNQDGPQAFFVRFREGVDPLLARERLQTVADGMYTDSNGDGPVTVLPVQRPAEIVNYRSMGTAPTVLGASLAVGAVAALALTLIASVRRRRRDLALLKTLGFTRRQLAATVAWQSTMAAAAGTIGGVPVGIVVGRWLWTRFAESIHVVPHTTVPGLPIALVAITAVVLANIVAAIPARSAARTPAAALLRAD